MSESFGIDIGDLPDVPPGGGNDTIKDTFEKPVAFKFAFVGVGQAGGRIANTFFDLGYRRICAVNTAVADLAELKQFSPASKLDIGNAQGAGKDPQTAAKLVEDRGEDIYDLFKRNWGPETDYAFVCLSAAGGTGAGASAKVAQVARKFLVENKRKARVGAIIALPKDSEGQRNAKNTIYTMKALKQLGLSPIIFIDNERFKELYGSKVAASQEKPASNASTAKILHTFNLLAGTDSDDVGGTTFDPADFSRILDSGVTAFAATTIRSWADPSDVSGPIRDNLSRSVLASVDLSQGKVAGLLYVLNGIAWNEVTVEHVDHGTQMMSRIINPKDSTVFYGMYPGNQDTDTPGSIQALAMIGGLPYPQKRLEDLAARAGMERDAVAAHFGV